MAVAVAVAVAVAGVAAAEGGGGVAFGDVKLEFKQNVFGKLQ